MLQPAGAPQQGVKEPIGVQLNQLNLIVTDVPAAAAFLETYFGLRRMDGGTTTMCSLWVDHGFVLVLMRGARDAPVAYPDGFHVGFTQPSAVQVDAINERLRADGFDSPPARRMHGSWAFYVQAPGGFMIDVSS